MKWPDDFDPALVERARALVRPQPPPADQAGDPAWPLVVADFDVAADHFSDRHGGDLAVALMHARDEYGRGKYGVPLRVGDGRDHLVDALQEALDGVVYARALVAENARRVDVYGKALDFLQACVAAVEDRARGA